MYLIENMTQHPLMFQRRVEIVEATDDPAKPRRYHVSGDVYEAKGVPSADVNAWAIPECSDPRTPPSVKLRDELYKELSAQAAFSALVKSGALRATREEK
jgi:hypothetical protein